MNELRYDDGTRKHITLGEYREQQRKARVTKNCDGCGKEMSQSAHQRGQGLCLVCIDTIN